MKLVDSSAYLGYGEIGEMTQPSKQAQPPVDFITKETGSLFCLINLSFLSSLIGLFGIFTNAINMIVFYRQSFNTTTNISFFAMAISDMGCLVTAEWFAVCMNPYLETAHIQFIPGEVQQLTGGALHVSFCRITSWITVFITAERCLGVALPLKVKQIITLRRTIFVTSLVFVVNLSTLLPEYAIVYLDWKFVPAKNRSLVGLVYRSFKDQAYGLVYSLTSISGIMSFVFVIFLTTCLVTKLAQISKWRKNATGCSANSDTVSSRDKKTMKMIAMIAAVLIVCNIPGTALLLTSLLEPEFMFGKSLANSLFAFWSLAFVFEAINSSVNVFVYYRMSTKYRLTFNDLFFTCIKTVSQHSLAPPKLEQSDQ